jgi:hypothetical protein
VPQKNKNKNNKERKEEERRREGGREKKGGGKKRKKEGHLWTTKPGQRWFISRRDCDSATEGDVCVCTWERQSTDY